EPTAFLDLRHAVLLLDLVRDLCRERSLAVVLVVHDLNLAAMYCDRLVLLDKGEVHATGTPQEVLTYARLCAVYETELYVAPNDATGRTVAPPLSGGHGARLRRSPPFPPSATQPGPERLRRPGEAPKKARSRELSPEAAGRAASADTSN